MALGPTNIGTLASEPVNGGPRALYNNALAVATSTVSSESTSSAANNAFAVATFSNVMGVLATSGNNAFAVATATNRVYAEFSNLKTSKLTDYTIARPLQTHLDNANDNLLMQFKDCPNILKLLDTTLLELDKVTTDTDDFQKLILNVEEARGYQLDLLGIILGKERLISQDEIEYRNILLSQIQVITCDGTMTKILAALIMKYNYPLDDTSSNKIAIRTLTHNILQIYVKEILEITSNGGLDFIDSLIAAGSQARVIVNDSRTEEGNFFTFDNTILEAYSITEYDWPTANGSILPTSAKDFLSLAGPLRTIGTIPLIDIASGAGTADIATQIIGTFRILQDGDYTFQLDSNEGSLLLIDDVVVVDNNGGAPDTLQTSQGIKTLTRGVYRITVLHFERTGTKQLTLSFSGPDTNEAFSTLPPYVLSSAFGSGSGAGLGSIEDSTIGGDFVGVMIRNPNNEIEFPFGFEGSVGTLGLNEGQFLTDISNAFLSNPSAENLDQPPLPTTDSRIPVPTFG